MANIALFNQHWAEGRANIQKSVNDLKAGDFLLMTEHGCKNDCGPQTILYYAATDWEPFTSLTKIQGIIHVANDSELMNERFTNPNNGGSESDCIDRKTDGYNYTAEERQTFYTLVTIVISDETGRWLGFDREGYDYNRYVLFPYMGWGEMFAEYIQAERDERARRKAEQEEKDRQDREAIIAAFNEEFSWAPEGMSLKEAIKKYLERIGIKCRISVTKGRYYRDPIVKVYTDAETFERFYDMFDDMRAKYRYSVTTEDGWCTVDLFSQRFGNFEYITRGI